MSQNFNSHNKPHNNRGISRNGASSRSGYSRQGKRDNSSNWRSAERDDQSRGSRRERVWSSDDQRTRKDFSERHSSGRRTYNSNGRSEHRRQYNRDDYSQQQWNRSEHSWGNDKWSRTDFGEYRPRNRSAEFERTDRDSYKKDFRSSQGNRRSFASKRHNEGVSHRDHFKSGDRNKQRDYQHKGHGFSPDQIENERGFQRKHSVRGGQGREQQFRERAAQLDIPESITSESLDPQIRAHLRSLNAENADRVGRHLAYAGEMLDIDPEVAYAHAKAAYAHAARIDIVREAVGIAAYVTGRYSEALSELRTYRRMSDDYSHVALEADAERGLGRSEKALRFIEGIPLNKLDPESKVELAIVTSGARADVGNSEGGLSALQKIKVENLSQELAARVELVIADRYEELGKLSKAEAIRAKWAPLYEEVDAGDMLVDLADVLDDVDPEAFNEMNGAEGLRDSSAESATIYESDNDGASSKEPGIALSDRADSDVDVELISEELSHTSPDDTWDVDPDSFDDDFDDDLVDNGIDNSIDVPAGDQDTDSNDAVLFQNVNEDSEQRMMETNTEETSVQTSLWDILDESDRQR